MFNTFTEEDLTREIADKATKSMWRKISAGETNDQDLKSAVAELSRPWVRARLREGRTAEDIDEIMMHDALFSRRMSDLFKAACPRLLDQAIEKEVANLVSRGEIVDEINADGETYFYRLDD